MIPSIWNSDSCRTDVEISKDDSPFVAKSFIKREVFNKNKHCEVLVSFSEEKIQNSGPSPEILLQ